jgi:hypothetical protein
MHGILRLGFFVGVILLFSFVLHAQSNGNGAQAQEDFALAVAKAHARTSLFSRDGKLVSIQAMIMSYLALHGTGKGTYENTWVDAEHWQRVISFADLTSRR